MRLARIAVLAAGLALTGLAGCSAETTEPTTDPDVNETPDADPPTEAACAACTAGKAGADTWCADCSHGYVGGEHVTDCKGCYDVETGAAEACET